MMRMLNQSARDANAPKAEDQIIARQTLEINPAHPIIVQLYELKSSNEPRAKLIAEQLFDNALVAAGLLDDPRTMLPRLNRLLELLSGGQSQPPDGDRQSASPYPQEAEEQKMQDFIHEAFSDEAMAKMKSSGDKPQ
jgi:hypothetical protein